MSSGMPRPRLASPVPRWLRGLGGMRIWSTKQCNQQRKENHNMGSGSFDAGLYRAYTSTTTGKTTDEVFASRGMNKLLDPKGVKMRESRDSTDNPNSTPVIVAIDVTGSMGII